MRQPGRGLPPLAPNLELLVLADDRQIAGQIRRFDRELGDRPGVVLAANSVLDRYPADLRAIPWHVLIADEALRYANPATEAHQALAQVRFGSVADCWLLTATPRGKSAEHLDVLVGLAVGDEAMISERLNTREAAPRLMVCGQGWQTTSVPGAIRSTISARRTSPTSAGILSTSVNDGRVLVSFAG